MILFSRYSLIVGLVIGLSPSALADPDTCLVNGSQLGGDLHVWRVDKDMLDWGANGTVFGGTITIGSVIRRLDTLLQYTARHNRPRVRNRVSNLTSHDCVAGPGLAESCVASSLFSQSPPDFACYPNAPFNSNDGPPAYADCDPTTNACFIVMCPDGDPTQWNGPGDFDIGPFDQTLLRALLFDWGLGYVDTGVSPPWLPDSCPYTTSCFPGSLHDNGCDEELMCSSAACLGAETRVRHADGIGLRQSYPANGNYPGTGSYPYRRLHKITYTGGVGTPSGWLSGDMSRLSIDKARMDCSRVGTATNDCVMIRTIRSDANRKRAEIRRLHNWSTTSWSVGGGGVVANQFGQIRIYQDPDIALSPDGKSAWFVFIDDALNKRVHAGFIDLDPSSSTYKQMNVAKLSMFTTSGAGLGPMDSTRPPRIAWSDNMGEPVVLAFPSIIQSVGNEAAIFSIKDSGGYDIFDPLPASAIALDRGPLTGIDHAAGEADIDCSRVTQVIPAGRGTQLSDSCAVVFGTNTLATSAGEIQVVRFATDPTQATANTTFNTHFIDASPATIAVTDNNAVIGVSYDDFDRIHVSLSTRVSTSFQLNNTNHLVLATNLTVPHTYPHSNEAESTCVASPVEGYTIPAMTPFGGASIAHCESCGVGGTLESIYWGRPSDGPVNFCH